MEPLRRSLGAGLVVAMLVGAAAVLGLGAYALSGFEAPRDTAAPLAPVETNALAAAVGRAPPAMPGAMQGEGVAGAAGVASPRPRAHAGGFAAAAIGFSSPAAARARQGAASLPRGAAPVRARTDDDDDDDWDD